MARMVSWLTDGSPETVARALRTLAPELGECPIVPRGSIGQSDPMWQSSSAVLDEKFVVKYAWSHPAALRRAYEISILRALTQQELVPFLPEIVVASTDPALLVTRRVPGTSLFAVAESIDRERAGSQIAKFLAALHSPATLHGVEAALGGIPDASRGPQHPVSTQVLRERFGRWIREDQQRELARWCDWADEVLAAPRPHVLVHADLHGDNQVWDRDELLVMLDFETAGTAEPEYDLMSLPATGPGLELLAATIRHYEQISGRRLETDRVMAWHLRSALGDALWRSEAGIHLPDHRSPAERVDDISTRFAALGRTMLG